MADKGDLTKAINAQATILEIGGDEFLTMFDIAETGAHAINTIATRVGRADFFASPIREVSFKTVVSKDVHDTLKALNTLDVRFKLPVSSFTMRGLALSGAADDIVLTFSATVPILNRLAGEQGWLLIEATLRIDNSTFTP